MIFVGYQNTYGITDHEVLKIRSCSRGAGIVEYWNSRLRQSSLWLRRLNWHGDILFIAQYSIVPSFQFSKDASARKAIQI
jgi:hypothetical protein